MRIAIIILVVILKHGYTQDDYNAKLSLKLEEIRKLTHYNNSVVVHNDSSWIAGGYNFWDPKESYIETDRVFFKGRNYEAIKDNQGRKPSDSPNEWYSMSNYHPYRFLRDSVKTDDLKTLLASDHPYVRTYAFGALVNKKYGNLFQIVVDNLKDTTRIVQFTGDVGFEVSPADLMISYTIEEFNSEQKDILKRLILTRYTHLNTLNEVLLFHKPIPDEYQYVLEIAKNGLANPFGLIALSKYRNPEDVELIHSGFSKIEYYSGHKVFFMAIENFPHPSFRKDLIDYKSNVNIDYYGSDEAFSYYFNALAVYQDVECLRVLEEIVNQKPSKKEKYFGGGQKTYNLKAIYRALKKYYSPMYNNLINKIERLASDKVDLTIIEYRLEDSPWNN